ncbi:MAG: hypothetical protein C0594_06040 [Marinilabiliales bacterium]|nr:MAG: hypothetical protein C0594_06040 [Marinilabiliales bacterium]
MEETIVFEAPYAKIIYKKELKLLSIYWNGKTTSEEYRSTINKGLDHASKAPIENYLSDIRNQSVVGPNDRKWFETDAIPRAIELGLKQAAVVFDGNVFKKYYLNLILKSTNKFKLPLKFFNEEEHAIEWFKTFNS